MDIAFMCWCTSSVKKELLADSSILISPYFLYYTGHVPKIRLHATEINARLMKNWEKGCLDRRTNKRVNQMDREGTSRVNITEMHEWIWMKQGVCVKTGYSCVPSTLLKHTFNTFSPFLRKHVGRVNELWAWLKERTVRRPSLSTQWLRFIR